MHKIVLAQKIDIFAGKDARTYKLAKWKQLGFVQSIFTLRAY